MTGTELFEALSFVDEKFIQEAETANLGRNTPWMKVLSVVACLCILITGVYAYSQMQSKGAMESMIEAAATEAAVEEVAPAEAPAATEAAAAPKQESAAEEPAAEEGISAATGELEQISYVQLRILGQTDSGFAAVVEAVSDEPTSLEVGMELTIVFDGSKIPGNTREVMPDTSKLTENTPVAAEDGAYDAGTNTLYVVEVFFTR